MPNAECAIPDGPGAVPPDAGPAVSVVIPTFCRPDRLLGAARSVFRQDCLDRMAVELVIVDNDPAASAHDIAEILAREAPLPVRYVPMPQPGLANARNAGVAAARAPLLAFLDDDEEAPPTWLRELLRGRERFDAEVAFGPVRARVPPHIRHHRAYFERFFSRTGPEAPCLLEKPYGCGNSLILRAAMPDPVTPFDVARNHVGGEDDLLFGQMKAAGARFAWAPDAWVEEEAAPDRMSLRYTLKRAFIYGQGPVAACVAMDPPRWGGVAYWMGVGGGQVVVYGIWAALQWLVRAPGRAWPLDRAVRGLGKVLWFPPFKFKIYGVAPAPASRPHVIAAGP